MGIHWPYIKAGELDRINIQGQICNNKHIKGSKRSNSCVAFYESVQKIIINS